MIHLKIKALLGKLDINKDELWTVLIFLGGIVLVVIAICSPLLYWVESANPDANIKSLPDAVWLSFMIVTTIGFGDFYPVTLVGRLIAAPLAATGIGVFGTLAGYLGSMILDQVVRAATTDMLHEQNRRIEELTQQNHDLNSTIKEVAVENHRLNSQLVEISRQNEMLNRKTDNEISEILVLLKNMDPR